MWTEPLIIQVDPWGGIAIFCDAFKLALLADGPRAWIMWRGRLVGPVSVGVA